MKQVLLAIGCVLLVSILAQADPPPFGTVVQRWPLRMSGSYAGSGITWRRDSREFYLMDQGYAGTIRVWTLDPADPESSIAQVPWAFKDLGTGTQDIPWSIAWDNDSGCFWISNIVDGDIYGGCFLMRYVWNGARWVWGGASGDSWYVGNGSNGGGLECLWTAGIEKNHLTGIFYFVPVSASPCSLNRIGKFDPYTKTNLGRLPYGDSAPGRALTLMPWDSAYIVTCGWSSGLVKLDTLGRILQRADSIGYGTSDMTVMWPRPMHPDDTVCIYSMTSSSQNYFLRISTGMLWRQLPSAFEHSVRPDKMLVPVGVVDSGETVVPLLVVRNDADVAAEDVSVHLLIDNEADRVIYHDSLVVALAPRSSDTLEFSSWTATGRDSMGATAWTYWVHDRQRSDDTLSAKFLVRVKDVGITAVNNPIPGDTIDPDTVYPSCVVSNHGNITVTVPMVFNIGPYWDTVRVQNLIAGGSRPATADRPWVASRGVWRCLMKAEVDRDLHPENNDTTFIFYVREAPARPDAGVDSIPNPIGIMDTLPFTPQALVFCFTFDNNPSSCTAWFWIDDSNGSEVYEDRCPLMLQGRFPVCFSSCTLRIPGYYAASCSMYIEGDVNPDNDVLRQGFWVAPGTGLGEKPKAQAEEEVPEPTVVRGALFVPLAFGSHQPATLHDPVGRLVMVLKPGQNDIRRLAPGIYYLRLVTGEHAVCRKFVKLE